jgi:hypothetical protein|tara:strand:- start:66 stop:311 length:246 start_codon:yes stop_codon:yes gene_type:complete
MKAIIKNTLNHIKEQTGIVLKPCDHFTGLKEHKGKIYFNAVMKERIQIFNKEYNQLLSFSEKYKTVKIEKNGVKRIAITPL